MLRRFRTKLRANEKRGLTYGHSHPRFALDTAPHSCPVTRLHYLSRHWITSFRLFLLRIENHKLW
jgi:hypothetical protein